MGQPLKGTSSAFTKLLKQVEEKSVTDSKELGKEILGTIKDISTDAVDVVKRMTKMQLLFKKGVLDQEEYEDILDLQKLTLKNFLIGAALDTVNLVFNFLKAFIKWAEPIVKKVLSVWIQGLAAKHNIKVKM